MRLLEMLDSNRKKNLILFSYASRGEAVKLAQAKIKVTQALSEGDMKTAMSIAGQAAVLYGAAGLLLHHKAAIKDLTVKLKEPAGDEVYALNIMAKLLLCKHLVLTDPTERERAEKCFPQDAINSDEYWSALQTELVKLANLNDKNLAYAQETAERMKNHYQTQPA